MTFGTVPRLAAVRALAPYRLALDWKDGANSAVDLAGWIATGAKLLEPLQAEVLFATARLGAFGSAVVWGEDDGDLAIDTVHLEMLAQLQNPLDRDGVIAWQQHLGLSNAQAAALAGCARSTWAAYRAGKRMPAAIQLLLRAAEQNPVIVEARIAAKKRGRPRKVA